MAEVTAKLNNLRLAPRKVRAVTGLLMGKDVSKALSQLEFYVRRPAIPLKKLLNSAIANAENNFNMVRDNLYIKELIVDEGAKLRRFRAKGFGRSALIQKKTSHIKLVLGERVAGLRVEKKSAQKKEEPREVKAEDGSREAKRPTVKREMGSKGNLFRSIGKRLFQRKAV